MFSMTLSAITAPPPAADPGRSSATWTKFNRSPSTWRLVVILVATWSDHTFEPDPPIYTSRIWMAHHKAGADCMLGFARRSDRSDGSVDRVVWVTDHLAAGSAVLMTTYAFSGEQVIPTSGPIDVTLAADSCSGLMDEVWQTLDPTVKVAAFAISPGNQSTGPLIVPS